MSCFLLMVDGSCLKAHASWLKAHGSWPIKIWRGVPQAPGPPHPPPPAAVLGPLAPRAMSHEPLPINKKKLMNYSNKYYKY